MRWVVEWAEARWRVGPVADAPCAPSLHCSIATAAATTGSRRGVSAADCKRRNGPATQRCRRRCRRGSIAMVSPLMRPQRTLCRHAAAAGAGASGDATAVAGGTGPPGPSHTVATAVARRCHDGLATVLRQPPEPAPRHHCRDHRCTAFAAFATVAAAAAATASPRRHCHRCHHGAASAMATQVHRHRSHAPPMRAQSSHIAQGAHARVGWGEAITRRRQ